MAGNLTAMIASIFSGSAVTADPYYKYTTLLLPGNGTNGAQNNTFLDGSTNNFTITRNGNTTQGTFSPFSQTGWGNYFNGSSQYLTWSPTSSTAFGTAAFTVETWIYLTSAPSTQYIIDNRNASQLTNWAFAFGLTTSGKLGFYDGVNVYEESSASIAVANQWMHCVTVRDASNNISVYINGTRVATGTSTTNISVSSNTSYIGTRYNVANLLGGYVSNTRITKGRAVYDPTQSNLTVPTTPLTRTTGGTNPPQGTECSLLTCQSNRFLDSNGVNTPASSPLTITANGSPTVVAFSPFNPTASWSAATYGGSGYFDGSADYLTGPNNAAFNFGTGDFCVEFFVYPNDLNFRIYLSSADNSATQIGYDPGNGPRYLYFYNSTAVFTGQAGTFAPNQWNHLALCRSGTTLSFYCNGARIYTNASYSSNVGFTTPYIGEYNLLGYPFLGYISNLRMVKGASVYTPSSTTLTVPTAPLTAITNTSLLLNFTNAGIYDATSKNDLETVGNAQISTAISAKWGSGTIALDGNGDYLNSPSSQLNVFGTGDFTIEMWAYITDYTTGSPTFNDYGPFFDFRTANTSQVNVVLSFLSTFGGTGRPCMFINGAVTITGNVMTTNSWTHIALSRVSGVTRMYMGGDQAGSNYTDTNNYTSTVCTIGVNIARDAFLKGYIQDPRITRGYGRYVTGTGGNAGKMVLNGTNTLALPTAAFPTL